MSSSGKTVQYMLWNHIWSYFRDSEGFLKLYEAIAVIEYHGQVSASGTSAGHYTCDVKDNLSSSWFRTNDDRDPFPIDVSDVTQNGYVVLFKRAWLNWSWNKYH